MSDVFLTNFTSFCIFIYFILEDSEHNNATSSVFIQKKDKCIAEMEGNACNFVPFFNGR